jgi:hypothetical protein
MSELEETIIKRIQSFKNDFRFNEHHHAWLRHLDIKVSMWKETSTTGMLFTRETHTVTMLKFQFVGALCTFQPVIFKLPDNLSSLDQASQSKEALLLLLESKFNEENCLASQSVMFVPFTKYGTEECGLKRVQFAHMLYLDFQYAQGMPIRQ